MSLTTGNTNLILRLSTNPKIWDMILCMMLIIWDDVVTPLMLCDELKCISVITELWNKNTQKIWVCQHHFRQFFCFIEFRPNTADVFRDKAPAISYLFGHLSWVDIWELYERLKLICKNKEIIIIHNWMIAYSTAG